VGQSSQAPNPAAESMSFWQARRAIIAASRYVSVFNIARPGAPVYSVNPSSLLLTFDRLEFNATNKNGETKHLGLALKDVVERLSTDCVAYFCWLKNESETRRKKQPDLLHDGDGKSYGFLFGREPAGKVELCKWAQNYDDCMHAAGWFASALNGLHATAVLHPAAAGDFHQQAAAWRALATKPPLAEGARVRRLAAEDAIKRQKPDEALNYYELGVEVDPMWAQGWFNAAVVAASLGYYADAVEHMQSYLELVPDATDAQSARDQIDLWRYKAGQQQPVPGK